MAPNPTGCFVLCCAAGVVLGLVLHLLELPGRRPLVLRGLLDLLYCGLCTLVLMVLCLTWNGGMLRLFQPLGMLLGIRLYFAGFGVLTRKAADVTGRLIRASGRKVKRLSSSLKASVAVKNYRIFSGKTIDNS